MDIRKKITENIQHILNERQKTPKGSLDADMPIFDTGLDSLGFAILITRLEIDLGYDPFVLMDEPVYPQTLNQFVQIYEQFKSHGKPSA